MKLNPKLVLGPLLLVALALLAAVGYLYSLRLSRPLVKILPGQEIRSYEGKDLSSVNDFRENSIKGPQTVEINSYRLKVTGLVAQPQELTYDQVLGKYQSYQKVVTLNCVEGWSATILWQGALLRDLLADAKPQPGATTVIFHAVDGYTESFPLKYFYYNDIILAYKMNGVTLTPDRGFPFQLVAESKWGYKWIKWIDRIELSSDANYQGYWEQRGYSATGSLDQPF